MDRSLRVALALLAAFAAWTLLVAAGALDAVDAAVGSALVDGERLRFWEATTTVGDRTPMAMLVSVLVLAGLARRDVVGAGLAGALPLAGWGLGTLLKAVVDRPRPDWALVAEDSAAYPSNHALTSWLLWVCSVAVLARHAPRRAWVVAAGAAPAVWVAWSRLALGVHHASDVVGSWLLGFAVLAALPVITAGAQWLWLRLRGTIRPAPDGA